MGPPTLSVATSGPELAPELRPDPVHDRGHHRFDLLVRERPIRSSELQREREAPVTGGHITAGEEIEQHGPVEERSGGSFQGPLHIAGVGFVRDDEGEVAAERREARDVAERDGPYTFRLERGDVELGDGDAPGEVQTIRFGRVELTHHAHPNIPDEHRACPPWMERSVGAGLDPPSDTEPAQNTIEDPLRIQRIPSAVLSMEPLPRPSCEEDREVLSLVDGVGEAEDVPDLEQGHRDLPA